MRRGLGHVRGLPQHARCFLRPGPGAAPSILVSETGTNASQTGSSESHGQRLPDNFSGATAGGRIDSGRVTHETSLDRLLADICPPNLQPKQPIANEALASGTAVSGASRGPTALLSNLHRRLASAATDASQDHSVASGEIAAKTAEQIERRRMKWSVSDVEFDVGITERLFPELRRHPTLHEVHYSDTIMREVDSNGYFCRWDPSLEKTAESVNGPGSATGEDAAVPRKELAATGLDEDAFLLFEAEAEDQTPTKHLVVAPDHTVEVETERSVEKADATHSRWQAAATASSLSTACSHSSSLNASLSGTAYDQRLGVGCSTPWFVPRDGKIRLESLPVSDIHRLLRFLMMLRGQEVNAVPQWLKKKLSSAQDGETTDGLSITLADVVRYLDDAPSPVIGFTECLAHPSFAAPAFIFVLYSENVSTQNVIGHIAALFSVPQRNFLTTTVSSKMSCSAILCAVKPNTLMREHLLLLNVLRHPGFILRVSSISEVTDGSLCENIFADLALWQPLHEVHLLLRRIGCASREELAHRLDAIREVGAVFFCANREASLARAATDILHGYYKSAIVNAMQRRRAPVPLRQFLSRPNVVSAARARKVTTDSTVRQVLKAFVEEKGDWERTVVRTPYVWRRRWINALRGYVWNVMASQRLRKGGRKVIPGDVVVRPEFREDARRRMVSTIKAEHVRIVADEAEAANYTLEDVYIPFLRGAYPPELFAPEESGHPIMTAHSMMGILRKLHAPQLLSGMSPAVKQLLDIRSDTPVRFRRFVVRPIEMSYTILEDRPHARSIHYDAARSLANDRLLLQHREKHEADAMPMVTRDADSRGTESSEGPMLPQLDDSYRMCREFVLSNSTLGAAIRPGSTSSTFFNVPSRDEYVVLGHAKRQLEGNLITAAPNASEVSLSSVDRLFSVEIRVIARNGASGVNQLLREHFILSGIEREDDAHLQHKIHRMRREVDQETPLLCAPVFCSACYNRCHDSTDSCAEFLFKSGKRSKALAREQALAEESLRLEAARVSPVAALPAPLRAGPHLLGRVIDDSGLATCLPASSNLSRLEPPGVRLVLTLSLRRRTASQLWGVRLTKFLRLVGLDDVSVVAAATAAVDAESEEALPDGCQYAVFTALANAANEGLPPHLAALQLLFAPAVGAMGGVIPDRRISWETVSSEGAEKRGGTVPLALLTDHLGAAPCASGSERSSTLGACAWQLARVNELSVHTRSQVAEAFLKMDKDRTVSLTFHSAVAPQDVAKLFSDGPAAARSSSHGGLATEPLDTAHVSVSLPSRIDISFSREDKAQKVAWGIAIGSVGDDTGLAVLNMPEFLSEQVGSAVRGGGMLRAPQVKAVTFPTLSKAVARQVSTQYCLYAVNGIPISCKEDVNGALCAGKLKTSLSMTLFRSDCKPKAEAFLEQVVVESSSTAPTAVPNRRAVATQLHDEAQRVPLTRDNCSTMQCQLLTPKQKLQSIVTIAVNRRSSAPLGKWGIRLQRGTTRLKGLQQNSCFSFQVFAPKKQHAVRVADSLRLVEKCLGEDSEEEHGVIATAETALKHGNSASVSAPVVGSPASRFSDYAYIVVGVNNVQVSSHSDLRDALDREASRANCDSITLQVRQYRLLNIALDISRSDLMDPVGFTIKSNMIVDKVFAESPAARAILEATNPSCSLRRLLTSVSRPHTNDMEEATSLLSAVPTGQFDFSLDEDAASLVEDPLLVSSAGVQDDSPSRSAAPATLAPEELNMIDGAHLPFALLGGGVESTVPIVWRLTYSARSGPLRTTMDVERSLRSGTTDTLFLQQCIEE